MGDHVDILGIEITRDGVIQIDIRNLNTQKEHRIFTEPEKFFSMLGKALQVRIDKTNDSGEFK